jgi:hypothetical protein
MINFASYKSNTFAYTMNYFLCEKEVYDDFSLGNYS